MSASDIDHIINHLSLKKSRRRWRIIALLAVAAMVIGLIANVNYKKALGLHVARLEINGLITGDDQQLQLIRDMRDDDAVKALILRINSPGGTTVGSEALYDELIAFGAEKPVVAVMDSIAASGGYITALAADRIYARKNTITGSIGVIFTYPDVSQLLGTVGVKMEEVKSGDLKAEPSGYKPTSDKARAVMQDMVNDGFGWFKGLVGTRRKLDAATVDRLADGRVYTGRQALKEKLIDEIGTEAEARIWLATAKDIPASLETITREPPAVSGQPGLKISFSQSAINFVLNAVGLSELRQKVEATKLDGLLVLWHPVL